MQWLTLLVWVLIAGVALPAALIPIPSVAMHALFPVVGLGCLIAFTAGAPVVFAWIALACAAMTILIASVGAHTLVEDSDSIAWIAVAHKWVSAALLGFELVLLAAVLPLTLAVAVLRLR